MVVPNAIFAYELTLESGHMWTPVMVLRVFGLERFHCTTFISITYKILSDNEMRKFTR